MTERDALIDQQEVKQVIPSMLVTDDEIKAANNSDKSACFSGMLTVSVPILSYPYYSYPGLVPTV